jgi:rod shape-determining protein MreB
VFKALQSLFSYDAVLELAEHRISLRKFETHEVLEYEPLLALATERGQQVIKAVGAPARSFASEGVEIVNPFAHPRVLVANFQLAEKLLLWGVKELSNSRIRPAPRLIIHPLEKLEGGLTDIELRVFRELALGCGARAVKIHVGERINTRTLTFDMVQDLGEQKR